MVKNIWKWSFIFMTIIIVLTVGLKYDGSLSRMLERRSDFINNVQMGGDRYTFSFASLKYYLSCVTEPFAFKNIFGNAGSFAVLAFLACGAFPQKKVLYSFLYCFILDVGIELFQYLTWFGALDVSDIFLRMAGILVGILVYFIAFAKIKQSSRTAKTV